MKRSPLPTPFLPDTADANVGVLLDDQQEDDYQPSAELDPAQLTTLQMAVDRFLATIIRRAPQADRLALMTIGAAQILIGLFRLSPDHAPEIASAINPQLAAASCRLVLL